MNQKVFKGWEVVFKKDNTKFVDIIYCLNRLTTTKETLSILESRHGKNIKLIELRPFYQ